MSHLVKTKHPINVRLRYDQEAALKRLEKSDPEMDRSKLIRRAVDVFLKNLAKNGGQLFSLIFCIEWATILTVLEC